LRVFDVSWLLARMRSVVRCFLFISLLSAAAVDCMIRRPRVGAQGAVWIHGWCSFIVRVLGFRYEVEGQTPTHGAVVSNHLSYLDILLYSALQPFVMVAKKEVLSWPLLGWLTARAGTVYVERGGGPATYPAVNAAMAEAYRSGLPVLFFPEGTTTDGEGVLPFRRGLFHSVLNNAVSLRTSAVRYSLDSHRINGEGTVERDVCWWGDMTFGPHLFRLLGLRGVRAQIRFGDEVLQRSDRFVLSETAQAKVAAMYQGLETEAAVRSEAVSESEFVEAM
jgi:lyso-ornithine lipid O-acyltransferase